MSNPTNETWNARTAGMNIGVLYSLGSVSPLQLKRGSGKATLTWIVDDNFDDASMRRVLEATGKVTSLENADPKKLDAILAFSDDQLTRRADLAAQADLPGHDIPTSSRLVHKSEQRHVLGSAGLVRLRSAVIRTRSDFAAAGTMVGFPAILKPDQGAGSRETHLIRSEQELAAQGRAANWDQAEPEVFVLEEFLNPQALGAGPSPGMAAADYVSVETLSHKGQTRAAAIVGKLPMLAPFRETGHFFPPVLPYPGVVAEYAEACVTALGVTDGVCQVEVKLTPSGPQIIEVNGRMGGFVAEVLIPAGVDLVRGAIATGLGLEPWAYGVAHADFQDVSFCYSIYRDQAGPDPREQLAEVRRLPQVSRVQLNPLADDVGVAERGLDSRLADVYGVVPTHDGLHETAAQIDAMVASAGATPIESPVILDGSSVK